MIDLHKGKYMETGGLTLTGLEGHIFPSLVKD